MSQIMWLLKHTKYITVCQYVCYRYRQLHCHYFVSNTLKLQKHKKYWTQTQKSGNPSSKSYCSNMVIPFLHTCPLLHSQNTWMLALLQKKKKEKKCWKSLILFNCSQRGTVCKYIIESDFNHLNMKEYPQMNKEPSRLHTDTQKALKQYA